MAMRVGIFTESYPPLINGVSTSVRTLIAQLEAAGHVVYVFTSRYPRYADERAGVFRFPSFNSITEPDYVLPIPIAPRIMAAIPGLQLDIVHSQSPFLLGLIAQQVARRLGLPHISTNHTLYTEYAHYFRLPTVETTRRILVWRMRRFYNHCDHVLAPSQMTRRLLADGYGIRVPITVIPTGIPAPPYVLARPEDTRAAFGLPAAARILLYVGRLAPEKNLPLLLRAFEKIQAQTENTFLVLAGSGKSATGLRETAQKLGIANRTRFVGFLDRTRLDPLYQTTEVFLFPSKTETQGLAVGEAMAAGVPCVVVNAGGAPEAVADGANGFLIDDDADEMAARALQLLNDGALRRHLSDGARAWAETMTPDKTAGRVMEVYEGLIGEKAQRTSHL